jgi:hypothetical protein
MWETPGMSGPGRQEDVVLGPSADDRDRLIRATETLRRQAALLADLIADTEERLAATFEEMARTRPPPDAERLLGHAARARLAAAKERDQAARYRRSGGDG